jgi:hypothetical protein
VRHAGSQPLASWSGWRTLSADRASTRPTSKAVSPTSVRSKYAATALASVAARERVTPTITERSMPVSSETAGSTWPTVGRGSPTDADKVSASSVRSTSTGPSVTIRKKRWVGSIDSWQKRTSAYPRSYGQRRSATRRCWPDSVARWRNKCGMAVTANAHLA